MIFHGYNFYSPVTMTYNLIIPIKVKTMNEQCTQEYLNFLLEVLQKVADDPNPKSIYPFLEANLDKLDENLL